MLGVSTEASWNSEAFVGMAYSKSGVEMAGIGAWCRLAAFQRASSGPWSVLQSGQTGSWYCLLRAEFAIWASACRL